MTIEWDAEKNRRNQAEHGLAFSAVSDFDWNSAQVALDERHDYGEARFIARGLMAGRLHVLVYTLRDDRLRIISFRKANARERRAYAAETGRSEV